jgi:2-dehydropantoate 2-reductase
MPEANHVYILGGGAIGLTLAAHLLNDGRPVTLVRTSTDHNLEETVQINVDTGNAGNLSFPVEMRSLARLGQLNGIAVVTAKSYANEKIAAALKRLNPSAHVVVMQNGINVERAFLEAGFQDVSRCVLYATAQTTGERSCTYRRVASSPIGMIQGDENPLVDAVATLSTEGFSFHVERNIQHDIWKKAIINAVFNSVCPLLETDNGIFVRDAEAARLALEIVRECLEVAGRLNLGLEENVVMEQLFAISARSDGQLISTLQDLNARRPTEIESLNLEIARIADSLSPPVTVSKTKLLGELVLLKSKLRMGFTA